jgi:hypothetical protein
VPEELRSRVEIRAPTKAAVDLAIAACDGEPRAAITALIALVDKLEEELSEARSNISRGYVRGRNVAPG